MNDSNDFDEWLYTTMLTGQGAELGDARALQVVFVRWLLSTSGDEDEVNLQQILQEKARTREWMGRYPDAVSYCFELDAIHQDLDWLLSEWDNDVGTRFRDQPERMRQAVVYHLHNYHYRVYAYRDKVAQLLNACLNLGFTDREANVERVLTAIRTNGTYRELEELLSDLVNDQAMKAIVERRNRIAHRALLVYRSGRDKWDVITAAQRAEDYFKVGGLGEEAELFVNLEGFTRQEIQTLRKVMSFLARWRYALTKALIRLAIAD